MSGEILQSQIPKPKSYISGQWARYKQSVIYVLLFLMLFTLWHQIIVAKYENRSNTFIYSQLVFFILGVGHFFLFYWFLSWAQKKNLYHLKEISLTAVIAILGFLVFFIKLKWNLPFIASVKDENQLRWSVIPFIIPFLIMKAWDFWEAIPEREYKGWKYPAGMEPPVIIPSGEVSVKINLQLQKKGQIFQAFKKYDLDLNKTLGDHLHFLIYDFPNSPGGYVIEISDPITNTPYNWIFTINPFLLSQKVLDFNIPVKELNLKTGMTIDIQNL